MRQEQVPDIRKRDPVRRVVVHFPRRPNPRRHRARQVFSQRRLVLSIPRGDADGAVVEAAGVRQKVCERHRGRKVLLQLKRLQVPVDVRVKVHFAAFRELEDGRGGE